jgi:cytochrome c oxidase subunit II
LEQGVSSEKLLVSGVEVVGCICDSAACRVCSGGRAEHAASGSPTPASHLRPAHADLLDLRGHRRVVFGVIFWSIIHHRKSRVTSPPVPRKHQARDRLDADSPLILIGMAWPATTTLIDMYDTGGEDMTVEVRGYQWRWQYKYLDDDLNSSFGFFSNMSTPRDEIENRSAKGEFYLLEVDNPLRIPVNRKVRFLLTAEDVIHAWWVPEFGLKRDAIPGMLNELWTVVNEPGIYRGQCTELCGKDHGFMPIVVEAMPEDEYDAWYANQLEAEQERQEALSRPSPMKS